jgi:hypothetical protein
MVGDLGALLIIFLPVLLGIGIVAWKAYLRHQLMVQMLEERRLLIEKGVTDLPKLELPVSRGSALRRAGLFDLRGGIVFVSVAVGLAIHRWVLVAPPAFPAGHTDAELELVPVLFCLGLGLICFHFIARAHTTNGASQGNGSGSGLG